VANSTRRERPVTTSSLKMPSAVSPAPASTPIRIAAIVPKSSPSVVVAGVGGVCDHQVGVEDDRDAGGQDERPARDGSLLAQLQQVCGDHLL